MMVSKNTGMVLCVYAYVMKSQCTAFSHSTCIYNMYVLHIHILQNVSQTGMDTDAWECVTVYMVTVMQ